MSASLLASIDQQNGPKRLLQKISGSSTAAVSTIASTTIDDEAMARPVNSMICLQCKDSDFFYELRHAGATTAVTDESGARPGVFVQAKQQEFIILGARDAVLDILTVSATGNVSVFLVPPA